MKKLLVSASILSVLLVSAIGQRAQAQDVTVSFQAFYDNLSPYGQWVDDAEYGNVWVPYEEEDFRPYGSRGHWVLTDYGNTWVSDDPWGWACYHYGRWTYNPYYGWVWIPGYEWAPAWVSWRYGGGYCGWAPLGPNVSISMGYNCPESWWIFVGPQYMYRNDCYSHWRGPSYNNTYIYQTTVVNNYYMDNSTRVRYNYGPRRDVIERDTHQPVQVYNVQRGNRPGATSINNNRVNIYRPEIDRRTASNARPGNVIQAPRQVGRPQQATNITPGRQPEFRQQYQRGNQQQVNRDQRNSNYQSPNTRDQRNYQAPNPRDQRGNYQAPDNRQDQRNYQQEQRNVQQQRDQQQRDQQQRDQQQREQQQRFQQQRDQQQRDQQQRDQQQRFQQQRDQQQRDQQQRDQQQREQQQRYQQQRDQQQREQQRQQQQYRPQPQQQNRPQPQQQQQNRPQPQQQQQNRPQPQQHNEPQHGGGRR